MALVAVVGTFLPVIDSAEASTIVTRSFSYTGTTETFTVPEGVSTLTVSMTAGQGGLGGGDSQGSPTPGGYRGVVSGTIAVTPGQEITVGVGGAGGTGTSSRGSAPGGTGGQNPFDGYDGATGGVAGPAGSSGGGGGGGAATVLRIDGVDVVAGGAGGNGGNGQFLPIVGRRAEETHLARPDASSTSGRPGLNTVDVCSAGFRCDGGASGAGGGGAQGGERGDVQYGGESATEYFGFGGYPGANSTAALSGLVAGYEFYAGNGQNGSVVISYDSGTPGGPRSVTGIPHPGAVALSWSAPSSSGSAAITDYVVEYATSSGGTYTAFADGVSTALTTTVTGLTNGTTYYFRVTAVNSYGVGPASTPMTIGVAPSDVPSVPAINALVPFDSGIYVDITPGHTDSPILSYEYRLDGGGWLSAQASANRLTIPGLANGRAYSVEVRAVNVIGASAVSAPQSATPRAVASAPLALSPVAGDTSVTLTWTVPTSDNGAALTDYQVGVATSVDGLSTTYPDAVSTLPSALVSGLTNGTTYYFRVAGVNAAGVGAFSTPRAATPFTTPGTPAIDSLAAGDGTLNVSFSEAFDGGSGITRYEYRLDASGAWRSTGSLDDHFVIGGLTNGTAYSVSVRAINAAGTGAASPAVTGTPRTLPAAPAISAVALDTGAVSVGFTVGSDGGSPLTNFEYSIDGGATWVARSPASATSPLTIGGLVGGETYAVRLRAVNAVGASDPSNESSVTAKGTPAAPDVSGLVESDRRITISFSAPANGGTPITNYEYSLDGGTSWTARFPASASAPLVVSGLTNGTAYGVRLRAVNAVGSGAASTTLIGTPRTVPGAPTIDADTIVGVDGALDVVFTAPDTDGGSTITSYQYSTDAGATWRVRESGGASSPLRITTRSTDGETPLTGGKTYPVEIRAVNAAGAGAASAVAAGITTTAPDAPVIESITGHDASATVTFTIPANGGAAITGFEYRLDDGEWLDAGSLSGDLVISGLNNSVTYQVEVRAVNDVGAGPASAPRTVRVHTTPGAPTIEDVVSGDQTLRVAFTPGTDGGADLETYQCSTDGGATWRTRAAGSTGSPLVITTESRPGSHDLINATVYAVQIRARNSAGAGDATLTWLAAPRGAPQAPTAITVSEGDGHLSVAFTPGSDGGSAITAIQYQLDGGAWLDTGSLTGPFTIGGLTNGTSYDVAVRARSAIGAGEASATVSATPRTVPGAPTMVTASVAKSSTVLSWAAPASNGGVPVTGYTATLYDAPTGGSPIASCTTTGARTCSVTGLTNGTTSYAGVVAANEAGAGLASAPRVAVTPLDTPSVSIAAVTPGAHELVVDVDTQDGGAAITTYEYRLDGGAWQSASTAADPFTISGLVTGRAYVVEVRAVNVVGAGAASAPVTATPHTKPGAPGALDATRGDASVSLTWAAPTNDGGRPITDYVVQYSTSPTGIFTTFAHPTSATTSATVTGLTNGVEYVFRIAAVNTAGTGSTSALVAATPLAVPSAPTITAVTTGSRYLQVAFTAGGTNGGSAITSFEYQLDNGAWHTTTAMVSPLMITGLTNGHAYTVAIRSVNAVGPSTASNARTATPFGLPGAVAGFFASPGAGSVTLSWDAADDNGSPITAYNVIRWSAATEGSILATYQTTNTSYTATGLADGAHHFTIEATNAAGTGARSSPRTSARIGSTAPGAPTIDAIVVTGDRASLDWTNGAAGGAPISGFVVQYVADGAAPVTVAMDSSSATFAPFELPSVGTPYSLRIAAISSVGAGTFVTVRPPLAATGAVSAIGPDTATVAGAVNANGSDAEAAFEYATSVSDLGTGAASVLDADPASVTGSTATATSTGLTRLAPGTTYSVRARATSEIATIYGETRTFTTAASVTSSGLHPTYTGTPAEVSTVTEPAELNVERSYEGVGETIYPRSTTPPTDAGTYAVTTTVADAVLTGSETATLTITPKPLTLTVTAADKSFDGTTDARLDLDLEGAVAGDDVRVDATKVSGTFDTADAGTDKVVTIAVSPGWLVGADVTNYTGSAAPEAVASIERSSQALHFTTVAPDHAAVGSTYVPSVVSSAGLPTDLAITDGPEAACALSGGEVAIMAPGTCVIVATQAGTANVQPAQPIAQMLSVVAPGDVTEPPGPQPRPEPIDQTTPGTKPTPDAAPGSSGDGSVAVAAGASERASIAARSRNGPPVETVVGVLPRDAAEPQDAPARISGASARRRWDVTGVHIPTRSTHRTSVLWLLAVPFAAGLLFALRRRSSRSRSA